MGVAVEENLFINLIADDPEIVFDGEPSEGAQRFLRIDGAGGVVGVLMTIARVRGVMQRSTASMSRAKPFSSLRRTGTGVAPQRLTIWS